VPPSRALSQGRPCLARVPPPGQLGETPVTVVGGGGPARAPPWLALWAEGTSHSYPNFFWPPLCPRSVVPVSQKNKRTEQTATQLLFSCNQLCTPLPVSYEKKKKQKNITQIVWKFRELGNNKEFINSEKENNIALHSGK
jgi:hypothetical protein